MVFRFGLKSSALLGAAFAAMMAQPSLAQDWLTTEGELLDRIQIEDTLLHYYGGLDADSEHAFSDYYTEDAVFDLNGLVARGREEIQAVYDNYASFSPGEALPGKTHVMMTNPRIEVNGDSAIAHLIWTEVNSDSLKLAPRVIEQGTEYSEFRKVDGRWLMSKRVIRNTGGLPDAYDELIKDAEVVD